MYTHNVPSSLFVKSTVLNPESNILSIVSMVQPYDYSCTVDTRSIYRGGALYAAVVLQLNIAISDEMPYNFKNHMGVALYGVPSC